MLNKYIILVFFVYQDAVLYFVFEINFMKHIPLLSDTSMNLCV